MTLADEAHRILIRITCAAPARVGGSSAKEMLFCTWRSIGATSRTDTDRSRIIKSLRCPMFIGPVGLGLLAPG
jgi:hypothetical protein